MNIEQVVHSLNEDKLRFCELGSPIFMLQTSDVFITVCSINMLLHLVVNIKTSYVAYKYKDLTSDWFRRCSVCLHNCLWEQVPKLMRTLSHFAKCFVTNTVESHSVWEAHVDISYFSLIHEENKRFVQHLLHDMLDYRVFPKTALPEFYYSKINSAKKWPLTGIELGTLGLW